MEKKLFEELKNRVCVSFGNSCGEECPFYPLWKQSGTEWCGVALYMNQEEAEFALAKYIGGTNYIRGTAHQEKKDPGTRREILEAAERCVCGDRDQEYGEPEDGFALIARLWEPIIRARCVSAGADVSVDAVTVALLMAELKIARASTNAGHMDSWVDLAGYAACGGEIAAGKIKTEDEVQV